jgi:hypothetical protein
MFFLAAVEVEHQVLDAGLLGRLELRRVVLVVGLDVGVAHGHLRCEALGTKRATWISRRS